MQEEKQDLHSPLLDSAPKDSNLSSVPLEIKNDATAESALDRSLRLLRTTKDAIAILDKAKTPIYQIKHTLNYYWWVLFGAASIITFTVCLPLLIINLNKTKKLLIPDPSLDYCTTGLPARNACHYNSNQLIQAGYNATEIAPCDTLFETTRLACRVMVQTAIGTGVSGVAILASILICFLHACHKLKNRTPDEKEGMSKEDAQKVRLACSALDIAQPSSGGIFAVKSLLKTQQTELEARKAQLLTDHYNNYGKAISVK